LKIFWLEYFDHYFFLKKDGRSLEEVPGSEEKGASNEFFNEDFLVLLYHLGSPFKIKVLNSSLHLENELLGYKNNEMVFVLSPTATSRRSSRLGFIGFS